ncbi:MAG: methylated-DNA--[protein]-cysteine S-methyltransferase [Micromonosporaceae bacterium]|nr:methylated-DNA--[protein]-cysteine S-methyltransferase [Micromonosporaceae bacterium]
MASPIGDLLLGADDDELCRLSFGAGRPPRAPRSDDDPLLRAAVDQLDRYFRGVLIRFTLPLALRGSDFERRVWAALRRIPYGETRSYGDIAKAVGDPQAARAVGIANNHNPVAVIVPCHRVIGADGKLVGYGGGLHRKRHLLSLEARVSIERDFAS